MPSILKHGERSFTTKTSHHQIHHRYLLKMAKLLCLLIQQRLIWSPNLGHVCSIQKKFCLFRSEFVPMISTLVHWVPKIWLYEYNHAPLLLEKLPKKVTLIKPPTRLKRVCSQMKPLNKSTILVGSFKGHLPWMKTVAGRCKRSAST